MEKEEIKIGGETEAQVYARIAADQRETLIWMIKSGSFGKESIDVQVMAMARLRKNLRKTFASKQ